jgi:hypothetical protein
MEYIIIIIIILLLLQLTGSAITSSEYRNLILWVMSVGFEKKQDIMISDER